MRSLAILATVLLLAACTGRPGPEDPLLSSEKLDLERFFVGRTVATGQFQDVFGTVRRRFDVRIDGSWDGRVLRLEEYFTYEDGSTETRIWTLEQTGPDSWRGTAPGVIGVATGVERGDTFNWRYTIDLPVPSADGSAETLRVTFDDWMWLTGEDRILNRAYMSRAGIPLGDVIIWFEK